MFLGLSRIDLPTASGAVLVPNPDLQIVLQTDSNGRITLQTTWPSNLVPPLQFYGQVLVEDLAHGGAIHFSNAIEMRAMTSSEAQEWEDVEQLVAEAFPKYDSSRALAPSEAALLAVDPRVDDLALMAATYSSSTIVPDTDAATIEIYREPDGETVGFETMVMVPLIETGATYPYGIGAIMLYGLNIPTAAGYAIVAGTDPNDPHFMVYGPSNSTGNALKLSFSAEQEHLGTEVMSLAPPPGASFSFASDADGDSPTWEEIRDWWMSTEIPGLDLPWWGRIIVEASWIDAFVGTHNPLSISVCIHAFAGMMAGCFWDGIPVNPT